MKDSVCFKLSSRTRKVRLGIPCRPDSQSHLKTSSPLNFPPMINRRVRMHLSGHLTERGGVRETKDSSNSIEAIARNYLFSVWSPTERNYGVSPEKRPGSERWPPKVREPLSRFSEVGHGVVLFVRARRAIAYRMATPSWPLWEPTSFSDRGLEHNLSNPSVRVDSQNDFVQLAAPRRHR